MECPLCSTALRQHLLQPTLSIISCPNEKCIYPFNLSISEMKQNNLILPNITNSDIMYHMESKMVNEAQVDKNIARFISKQDDDI
ncbi:uncharacterized protein RJT21DRAFT_120994, partial [Scheffersomyces amazonensis]|uniref:uncharacterized protein n=1 Tax=Scheffersomyces amazonensis TaxID=1078765 RepID=UPI00315DB87E